MIALVGCGFDVQFSRDSSVTGDAAFDSREATDGTDSTTPDAPLVTLVDRGLVARYFNDDAASGQSPSSIADSAPSPQNLPITFGPATFTEDNGNRGLRWQTSQSAGKIEVTLGTTKLRTELAPKHTVTIEVVVQITSAGAAGSESQITGLRGGNPDFMLTAFGTADLRFFKPFGTEGATWLGANTQQRMVLHLVFDTDRTNANERIELFRDGAPLIKSTGSAPTMGSSVGLGASDSFVIGNRQSQDRSIGGTIFYVAYYNVALAPAEIANNAQRLLANDDS